MPPPVSETVISVNGPGNSGEVPARAEIAQNRRARTSSVSDITLALFVDDPLHFVHQLLGGHSQQLDRLLKLWRQHERLLQARGLEQALFHALIIAAQCG